MNTSTRFFLIVSNATLLIFTLVGQATYAATNITPVGSTLKLFGDFNVPGDNDITIQENANPGEYEISANDLFVDGVDTSDTQVFTGVKNIVAELGTGSDTINLIGNSGSGTLLPGNLTVEVIENITVNDDAGGFDVKGKLIVNQTGFGNTGLAIDSTNPTFSTFGGIVVNGSNGNHNFDFSHLIIDKNIDLDIATGSGTLTLINGTVGGNLKLAGRTLNVNMEFVRIKGAVDIKATGDDPSDSLIATLRNLTTGKTINLTGGPGNDSISFVTVMTGKVGNAVLLNVDEGTNDIDFSDSTIGGSISVRKPSRVNNFSINNSSVRGKLSVDVSNSEFGDAGIALDVSDTNINKGITILGGTPSDTVTFNNADIGNGRSLLLDMADGTNTLSVNDSSFKGHIVNMSSGKLSDVNLSRARIGGSLRLDSRTSVGADDPFNLLIESSFVAKGVIATSGEPLDGVTITRSRIGGGKSLVTSLGEGDNNINIENFSQFDGDVVNKSPGALSSLNVRNSLFAKGINISATGNESIQSFNAGISDSVVSKTLTINSGDANDSINLNNLQVIGNVSLNAGGGDDNITLDAPGSPFFPSDYFGSVKVQMGDGNFDDLSLAGSGSIGTINTGRFHGAASFDGGNGGSDTINHLGTAFFKKGVTVKNFSP